MLRTAATFIRRNPGALSILLLVVMANAIALYPELGLGEVFQNDNLSHLALIKRIVQTVQHGGNPLDFWMPDWALGYPMVRTYPALAHDMVAAAYLLLGRFASVTSVFAWSWYLCLILTPVSFFGCALLLELPPLTAAAVALLAPLISTSGLYGLDFASYVWVGKGLFAQAVAVHFLLWALGFGFRAVCRRGALVPAGAMVGCTLLTHWVYGYIAALSICLLGLLPDAGIGRLQRVRRIAALGAVAFLLSGFQLITLIEEAPILNQSLHEPPWKSDSYGAATVLKLLFTGKLLDFNRLPVFSAIALAGAVLLLLAWKRCRRLRTGREFVLCGAVLWILLFFGRPFWGPALTLLAITRAMHLHRFLGGVHVFLVLLAGIALGWFWWEAGRRIPDLLTIALTLAILYPMARERFLYLKYSAAEAREGEAEYQNRRLEIDRIASMALARGGRVYARMPAVLRSFADSAAEPVRGDPAYRHKASDVLPSFAYLGTRQVPVVPASLYTLPLTTEIMGDFEDDNAGHYRLFHVATVVESVTKAADPPPFLPPPATIGAFHVYDAPPSSYFDLVNVTAAVHTTKESFFYINDAWMRSDWVARRAHFRLDFTGSAPPRLPYVDVTPKFPPAPSIPLPVGTVSEVANSGESYEASIDAAQSGYLLFKMSWHPNWKAYIDGKAAPTMMLSPGLTGIAVPQGAHRILCRYEPEALRTALAILGLVLTLVGGVWEWRRPGTMG